jgi:integrating conjugative element protein (TIGR03756 family)
MKAPASVALALSLLMVASARAGTIGTPDIVSRTASASIACMQWMPIGLCFWLECTPFGCSVTTSLKVGHYNPDLVVSSYNELGDNPWSEIRSVLGQAQRTAANSLLGSLLPIPIDSAGNRTEGTARNRDHKNLIFRETDAIGHPQGIFSDALPELVCESQTTPFVPYFQSSLDALSWRQEVPEIFYPASLIPGLRELGGWPLQTWGGVFPRTGWTIQAEEPKAAALNAQRAGDIVTRLAQPHVYLPVTETLSTNQQVWPPGPLIEADHRTGTWQMLLPEVDSGCEAFGANDLASVSGWGGGRVDPEGDYVWNLWRPYQCCEQRAGIFLLSVDWLPYPP